MEDLNQKLSANEISGWEFSGYGWMQGETDAANGAATSGSEAYKERLAILVNDMREFTNEPNLPFIVGRIYKYDNRQNLDAGPWYNLKRVRWAQTRVSIDIPYSEWVNTDDLEAEPDNPHYTSYLEMGRRFAHGYLNVIDGVHRPYTPFRVEIQPDNHATGIVLATTTGNQQVTLDWDHAVYADEYTLFYGTDPANLNQSITNITENQVSVSGLTNGSTYHFAVQAHNTDGNSPVTTAVLAAPNAVATNTAPWVWIQDLKHFSGYQEWIELGDTLFLDGTVRDNNPLDNLTFTWQKVSGGTGTGTVTFDNAAKIDVKATFSDTGSYVLRLTADDGSLSAYEEITVNVAKAVVNTAPSVDLGSDRSVANGDTLILNATILDDMKPLLAKWSFTWEKVSGPGDVVFVPNPNMPWQSKAVFSDPGEYIVQLAVFDSEETGTDQITIFVYEKGKMNLALNKSTSQSSTFQSNEGTNGAHLAVDNDFGNRNHTNQDQYAWWEVDLGEVVQIEKIKIYNRQGSVDERLKNFYVFVSDVPFTSYVPTETVNQSGIWYKDHPEKAGFPTIDTVNRTGRYVRIQLKGTNYLHMHEVQVIGPDLVPPAKPTGLTYQDLQYDGLKLVWNATSDNDKVVYYTIYQDNDSISTSIDTVFMVNDLTQKTPYKFNIKAVDGAGNESEWSDTLEVTTSSHPDQEPPSMSSNIVYQVIDNGSVELTWSPSTDNYGIYRYEVFLNGSSVAYTLNEQHLQEGLSPNTWYSFKITAEDQAGNVSDTSEALQVIIDTNPPEAPTGLTGFSTVSNSTSLKWNPATDNDVVEKYIVFQDGDSIGLANDTVFQVTGLTLSTFYSFIVKAVDRSGNVSLPSTELNITTPDFVDEEAPLAPTGLVATDTTLTTITVAWNPSSDNIGVTGYEIFLNGTPSGNTSDTTFTITGLAQGTSYNITIKARDATGNVSTPSETLTLVTLTEADIEAPTTPTGLVITDSTSTSISISWISSSDNIGVAEYEVYLDGSLSGTTTDTTFTVSGLPPGTTYEITLKSKDAAGNISGFSETLMIKTLLPDNLGAEEAGMLNIYPNPFTNEFNIVNKTSEEFRVKVHELSGRLIDEIISFPDKRLSLGDDWQKGIYIISVESGKSNQSFVILKQ